MKDEMAVELLDWMGYERKGDEWCNFKVDPSYTFPIHNIRDFALTELAKRDGVMRRVENFLFGHRVGLSSAGHDRSGVKIYYFQDQPWPAVARILAGKFVVAKTIELGMTAQQIKGVK